MVQATGNANGGGVQDGFAREAYQVVISGLVTKDSSTPTPRHIDKLRTRRAIDFDPMQRLVRVRYGSRRHEKYNETGAIQSHRLRPVIS